MSTRHTKIVCTIGPGTDSSEMLSRLMQNGMNVARFNFSHGSLDYFEAAFKKVRSIRKEEGYTCAILLDTKGPEIRTSGNITQVEIKENEIYTMAYEGTGADLEVTYKDIVEHCKVGQLIQMDGGLLQMTVTGHKNHMLLVKAHTNHVITSKRHVNLPGVHLSLPVLSDKDIVDINFGIEQGIDMIAASFVSTKEDIITIRKHIASRTDKYIPIIAKIESETGLKNIDGILEECDGIMVARGDLGVEIPYETIPLIQKMLVEKSIKAKKPVIMATQMLTSMVNNPTPTRAEITDIGSAIFAQVDAIMLSEETGIGKFPTECLKVMTSIAGEIEPTQKNALSVFPEAVTDQEWALLKSGVEIIEGVDASAIILITERVDLLQDLTSLRPQAPILLVSKSKELLAYSNLLRGVTPMFSQKSISLSKMEQEEEIIGELKKEHHIKEGEKVVFFFGILEKDHKLDTIQVRII